MTRFSAPLPRDEVTFPELLREHAGYFTGVCGRSFHLDGSNRSAAALRIHTDHGLKTFKNRVDYLATGPDEGVAGQVAEFLDKKPEDKPFFLWANFSDPHHPWNAPAEMRPDPSALVLPAHLPDLPKMRAQLADYLAEVHRIDRTIAGVLQILSQRNHLNNTLIVFCGDNGMAFPHGKGSLYDPGCHVPLVVWWPGVVRAASESRALVSGEDLAPTLLAAAGLTPHPRMSGVSILPLLKEQSFAVRQHVFLERGPHGSAPVSVDMKNSGYDLSRAVRSERFKFIYNCTPWIPYAPVDSAGGPGWREMEASHAEGLLDRQLAATYFKTPRPVYELYDLDSDPSELQNLSGQNAFSAVERELREALTEKMILDSDYLPLPALLDSPKTSSKR
jgi:arylsulfatase A-like enzyme